MREQSLRPVVVSQLFFWIPGIPALRSKMGSIYLKSDEQPFN